MNENLNKIRGKISQITEEIQRIRNNKKLTRNMRRNRRWMKRELKGRITLNGLLEMKEHKISVVKSMKYNKEKKKGQILRNKTNRLFDTDQRKVYNAFREILKNDKSDDVSYKTRSDNARSQTTLTKEDFEDFWPKIWSVELRVNLEAKWIKDVEQAISQSTSVEDDEIVNITKENFTNMLKTKEKTGRHQVRIKLDNQASTDRREV